MMSSDELETLAKNLEHWAWVTFLIGHFFLALFVIVDIAIWKMRPELSPLLSVCLVLFGLSLLLDLPVTGLWQATNRKRAKVSNDAYFLCVRSFRLTTHQRITQGAADPNSAGLPDPFILEDALSDLVKALPPGSFLFLLGGSRSYDPLRCRNVIRVRTDNTGWWAVFEALAEGARAILIFPETTPDLVRELCTIVGGAMSSRALVIMSPVAGSKSREPEWQRVRERLRPFGISLPAYEPGGLLYVANADLSIKQASAIVRGDVDDYRGALSDLLGFFPPRHSTAEAMRIVGQLNTSGRPWGVA